MMSHCPHTRLLRPSSGSHDIQPPRNQGLSDPDKINLLPPVDDPDKINLLPPVDDPSGLPGGHFHDHRCACRCCQGSEDQTSQSSTEHLPGLRYSGWVIVRLGQGFSDEESQTLNQLAEKLKLQGLLEILKIEVPEPEKNAIVFNPNPEFFYSRPLIQNLCYCVKSCGMDVDYHVRQKLADMLELLTSPRGRTAGSRLLRSWRVDCRNHPERIDDVVAQLSALPTVELAYREILAEDSAIESLTMGDPRPPEYEADQSYLEDAPVGIGALWARRLNLLENLEPIRLCDIEQRWVLNHQELLPAGLTQPFFGDNLFQGGGNGEDGNHGTAVLGQLVATGELVSGIAPNAITLSVASHYNANEQSNGNVAEAIVNTLARWYVESRTNDDLDGGIIVLEVQRGGLPTEVDHADREAIRLVTAFGLTVIEAGGNAGFDLDSYRDEAGHPILRREIQGFANSGFDDSGAVMVGAAWSTLPHDRASFSNYGSRVDCWGWGDSVATCGFGDYDLGNGQPNTWYTGAFSGTSAATPIVAGAAALLQAISSTRTGHTILPLRLREILSNPATGTPQGPNVAGKIGVMPNLCAIIEQGGFGLLEVYLRRTLADDGWTCRDVTCSCPDILVLDSESPSALNDATAAKQGPNHPAPGLSPVPTGCLHLFAKPRNRGLRTEENLEARFYHSPVATLIGAEMWQPIPCSVTGAIEQGGKAAPLEPLIWDRCAPDGCEHLAFLAVLSTPEAPNPFPALCHDWRAYLEFMRRYDVGCRNTHWIDASANTASFVVTGAPDRARTFDLEILQRLPEDAVVTLSVWPDLASKLRQSQPWPIPGLVPPAGHVPTNRLPVELTADPRIGFRGLRLPARACYNVELSIRFPGASTPLASCGYSVAIRQLYRGQEVGRITWYLGSEKNSVIHY